MATSAKQPGTNIALLSDGTGNSSAKLMKTNVWRMYEAIDLSKGDQIAIYDNGVGTSSFKPLAVLGGALGWGLKRNVRTLYAFACQNYRPGTETREADRLYAFGFSRGAFTARVLAGLIESQGLISGASGKELQRQAKWAYREYRRQFNATRILVNPLRALRDVALRTWERCWGLPKYDPARNRRVRVAFLGLWDMVDAYGLPVDEMTRGWDQWVWPLSVNAQRRPENIDKICHAVALDDERHTFHPVLFDETGQLPAKNTRDERVTQVWFAGAHSNVGGGYPDDSLARVPLRWMASEACQQGLRLHPFVCDEWEAHADPNGPAYDSRSGFGAYYRYNPRSIKKLTNDRYADVSVPRPKVHVSVLDRITAARDSYAPIVLPDQYAVVENNGHILDEADNPFEHPTQSQSRCADQERMWNWVWFRRVLYFSTVAVTLVLLVPPFVTSPAETAINPRSRGLSAAIGLIGGFIPGFLQPLTDYYQQSPVQGAVLVGALGVLMIASSRVQHKIRDGMRTLWDQTVTAGRTPVVPSRGPRDPVYRLRAHPAYRATTEFLAQRLFPLVFGMGALLVLLLIVMSTINRVGFAIAGAGGSLCKEIGQAAADANGAWPEIRFNNQSLCQATGITLTQGVRYTIEIKLPDDWSDAGIPVKTPSGFSTLDHKPHLFLPALPFRRILTAKWFVPVVRIGSHTAEYHLLDKQSTEVTPRRTGPLFLFVNDAIGPPPFLRYFYENNLGEPAIVTVRKVVVGS